MSFSTPANVAEEGGSRCKRRRVRKRSTKNRTNSAAETAAAAPTSDAGSSSSSSSSDDEEEKESSSRPSDAARSAREDRSSISNNKGSTVNTRAELPDEKKTPEDGEKAKRKRKRTRRKGEKKEGKEADGAEGDGDSERKGGGVGLGNGDTIAPGTKPQDKEFQSYLKSLNPSSSSSLSNEKTIKALEYALQYHLDRANWKFSKAKQEFLIRHMLTPPLAATHAKVGEVKESKEEMNEEEEVDRKADQFWPDEWNRCVARYLITIQGQAKQRIFDLLQREAQQEIPEIAAPAKEEEVSVQALRTSGARSVSFGDLAMDEEASSSSAQQSHQAANAITPEERQGRLFAKQRASTLLREMED